MPPSITLYYVRTGYPHCGELYIYIDGLGNVSQVCQADEDPMSNAAEDWLWPENHYHVYSHRKPATLEVQK